MRGSTPTEPLPSTVEVAKTNSLIQIQARNVVKGCGRDGGSVARCRGHALATW